MAPFMLQELKTMSISRWVIKLIFMIIMILPEKQKEKLLIKIHFTLNLWGSELIIPVMRGGRPWGLPLSSNMKEDN